METGLAISAVTGEIRHLENRNNHRWQRFERISVILGALAAFLAIVAFATPFGGWVVDRFCGDAQITSPANADIVPENVEVAVRIPTYDASDRSVGWLLSYCANSSCFPVMEITPTDGEHWHGVINVGPTHLDPTRSHVYTIRIDRLAKARIDAILADKEQQRATSPTGDWRGIPPQTIAGEPIDAVSVTRV